MIKIRKSYSELISIPSFEDRFKYLKLSGIVGDVTFGSKRYLNQILYKTLEWKESRRKVIIRDGGFDLAHEDYPISGYIYIHHINPITPEDILNRSSCVFDLDNLISASFSTHNAVHYSDINLLPIPLIIRTKNDTCPWR